MIGTDEPRGVSGRQSAVRLMALPTTLATMQIPKSEREQSPSRLFLTSEHRMMTAIHSRKLFTNIPDHYLLRSKGGILTKYLILFCSTSCMTSPFAYSGLSYNLLFSPFYSSALDTLALSSYRLRQKLENYVLGLRVLYLVYWYEH